MKKGAVLSILVAVAVLAVGAIAEAQQPNKISRIGFLSAASSSSQSANVEAFRRGLRDIGYVERKNIVVEYRYAEEKPHRLDAVNSTFLGDDVRDR